MTYLIHFNFFILLIGFLSLISCKSDLEKEFEVTYRDSLKKEAPTKRLLPNDQAFSFDLNLNSNSVEGFLCEDEKKLTNTKICRNEKGTLKFYLNRFDHSHCRILESDFDPCSCFEKLKILIYQNHFDFKNKQDLVRKIAVFEIRNAILRNIDWEDQVNESIEKENSFILIHKLPHSGSFDIKQIRIFLKSGEHITLTMIKSNDTEILNLVNHLNFVKI
ncbi:hypothetical protein AB3N62_05850 [Leptospira sp. WS4.C2]